MYLKEKLFPLIKTGELRDMGGGLVQEWTGTEWQNYWTLPQSPPISLPAEKTYSFQKVPLTETNNPYLEDFQRRKEEYGKRWQDHLDLGSPERQALVSFYAWALPDEEALHTVASFSPLGEVAAGNGYWAALLQKRGADILPFDSHPPLHIGHVNHFCRDKSVIGTCWTTVYEGDVGVSETFTERTLFLCWPVVDDGIASKALSLYPGNTLIYIGEEKDGCTGDDLFHQRLEKEWKLLDRMILPTYHRIHDSLHIYKRKRSRKVKEKI